jgi:hypothetical protein
VVDPSKGNDLAMTTACTAVATRISITLAAATMTKGKAPTAMTTIHLHGEQREAVVAAEINRRPAKSRISHKDPQDQKPYDTRTHLNEIAKSQVAFFLGPKCFGQRIRDEPIPHGFKIEKNILQYNGVDRPLTWLQDYFNAEQFAGGSPNIAVRYLPLMLSGTARQWINDLAENSI